MEDGECDDEENAAAGNHGENERNWRNDKNQNISQNLTDKSDWDRDRGDRKRERDYRRDDRSRRDDRFEYVSRLYC